MSHTKSISERSISTLDLLTLVIIISTTLQGSTPVEVFSDYQRCSPSLPCTTICLKTKNHRSTNHSIAYNEKCAVKSSIDGRCICENKTCYAMNSTCLHACSEHSISDIKLCVDCLKPFNKYIALFESRGDLNLCKSECQGICIDTECSLLTRELWTCPKCAPGYGGRLCDQKCSLECKGKCYEETGYCVECPEGRYGQRCDLSCSGNCLDGNCSTATGSCTACLPGFTGKTCKDPCPEGKFGSNCSSICPENCAWKSCEAARGSCLYGCVPGYFGRTCDFKCPPRTFGLGCLSHCSTTCAGDETQSCHHATGECTAGCVPGFMGSHCNLTCSETKYGTNCSLNCSETCFRRLCNEFSGICLTCEDPYYGPQCQYKTYRDRFEPGMLGSEVSYKAAFFLILLLVFLGLFMWMGVAYLSMHQRRKVLRDAAKGIDPRNSKWGFFTDRRAYKKALALYDKKFPRPNLDDTSDTSKAREGVDETSSVSTTKRHDAIEESRKNRKRGRLSKLMERAQGSEISPRWWNRGTGNKVDLPSDIEKDLVSKWLSHYHENNMENFDKTEESMSAVHMMEGAQYGGGGGAVETFVCETQVMVEIEEESSGREKDNSGEQKGPTTPNTYVGDANEMTSRSSTIDWTSLNNARHIFQSKSQSDHDIPSLVETFEFGGKETRRSQSEVQIKNKDSLLPQYKIFLQAMHSKGSRPREYIPGPTFGNVQLRQDAIYLSPQPHPGGPSFEPVLKAQQQQDAITKQWLRDKVVFSESVVKHKTRTSEEETTAQTSTEDTTSSSGTSNSSTSSTDSDDINGTNTEATSRTTRRESENSTSTSGTSSTSSSSDASSTTEETSTSTVIPSRQNALASTTLSTSMEGETTTTDTHNTNVRADTGTSSATAPTSLLQRLKDAFKGKNQRHRPEQVPHLNQSHNQPSVPGAGGMPRPFSHMFLINRLETWNRKHGLEVTTNDGMLEVNGSAGRPWNEDSENRIEGTSADTKTAGPAEETK